jgi:hypothetical protein
VPPPPTSLTSLVAGGAAVPSYMNVVVSEANVNSLMDMGFPRNLAEFALKACGDEFVSGPLSRFAIADILIHFRTWH